MIINKNDFKILKPTIFDANKVISGVTFANKSIFPPYGFSITNGTIYSDNETLMHRKFLADYINVDPGKMKFQKQVHGSTVRVIDYQSKTEESDGMLTDKKGLILNVAIADCAAILIYDPINNTIAAIHSGWRGSYENICRHGIKLLIEKYGSKPDKLVAFLSPCASVNNYEVGNEFREYFNSEYFKMNNGKLYYNNRLKIYNSLLGEGLKESNIEVSGICTIENKYCHSYRRDRENSGRMSAFIGLI